MGCMTLLVMFPKNISRDNIVRVIELHKSGLKTWEIVKLLADYTAERLKLIKTKKECVTINKSCLW